MLVAAFAYRYEPDWLVDQLYENLGWVDGFAVHDGRAATEVWQPPKDRQQILLDKAVELGATWVLHTAPDERFDRTAETTIREAIRSPNRRFSFPLREMWTPTHFRVDGIWGRKWRTRLGRVGDKNTALVQLPVNIYHLKMIEPENRVERARVHTAHNTWNDHHRGFDYLTDEKGLRLKPVPKRRGYDPPYRPYVFRVDEP